MKVKKTLLFMVQNPIPLIVQLICWFLFAVLQVMSDNAFTDKSLPGVVQLANTSLGNLPGSLENFAIIASIIFDEIIKKAIRNVGWTFIVIPAFVISYQEAKGNLKGITKERQAWMQWYDRQQEVIRQEGRFEDPPSTVEDTQVDSYFRKAQRSLLGLIRNPLRFILHFTCWLSVYVSILVVIGWPDIIDSIHFFVEFLPEIAIPFAIFAFLISYQETRGIVKGIAKETQVWTKWHQRQINTIAQDHDLAAPPPSLVSS